MGGEIAINCVRCGSAADLLKNAYVDATGRRVEWPKVTVRPGRLYFSIHCPNCGEREQCVAEATDTA
jgi:hypothetical protein